MFPVGRLRLDLLARVERQPLAHPEVDADRLSRRRQGFGLVLVDEVDGDAAPASRDADRWRRGVRVPVGSAHPDQRQAVDVDDDVLRGRSHLVAADIVDLDGLVSAAGS